MATLGDTLTHCTGTGAINDPYIYTTEEGFIEAIDVLGAYVEAGSSNLIFDANNGIITQVTFKCESIDGKGTTIRNLIANMESKNLIVTDRTDSGNILIKNINFYNMVIIATASNQVGRFINDYNHDNAQDINTGNKEFRNCNFTGLIKGVAHTSGYIRTYLYNDYHYAKTTYTNCTFNINLDVGSTVAGNNHFIFTSNTKDKPVLDNCTICLSGLFVSHKPSQHYLRIVDSYKLNNCVFTNSSNNPLNGITSNGHRIDINASSGSGYNYFKMNIEAAIASDLNLTNCENMLINRSKLTNFTINGSCISMQEDDPSQPDYIYDAENLANAGFLVGSTIQ